MRSFMPASVMTKVLGLPSDPVPFFLTLTTWVTSAPAWATRKRPGFEDQVEVEACNGSENLFGVRCNGCGGVKGGLGIFNSETSAGIDMR